MSTSRHPFLFYRFSGASSADASHVGTGTSGYACVYWRPGLSRISPDRLTIGSVVWWLMHQFRVFRNRDYAQMLIYRDSELVHRSHVFPGWFRFPFMERNDLQIGDTWTRESDRGHGLATIAITRIAQAAAAPGRAFWYVTDRENPSSIRVVEKAGFQLVGEGDRMPRFGTSLLGAFVIKRSPST